MEYLSFFYKSINFRGLLIASIFLGSFVAHGGDKDVTKIYLWEHHSEEVYKEMDKWIKVFEKKNPTIKIIRQHYMDETLRTKFLRSAATGDGADIVNGANDQAGVYAMAGIIKPLDKLFDFKKFSAKSVDMARLNGKIWGVPMMDGNFIMMYYNKKYIKKAPKTTDELIKLGKLHTDRSKKKYGLAMFQSEPFWFVPIMSAFDAWPLQKGADGRINVVLASKQSEKALKFLVSLRNEHKILPLECDYNCSKSMFLQERSPLHFAGDWDIKKYKEHFGDNLGIAPLPIVSETGRHIAPLVGGRFFFINKKVTGKKLEAAKKFINFATSKKAQLRLATKLSMIPASLEAQKDPKIKASEKLAQLIAATKHGVGMPNEVEMRAVWDGLRIMIQRAMTGKETISQAVKTGQKAADEALSAIRKDKGK